ncbi:MAG: acyl-CoA dehydrogenase family protein, partial [Acidimicrobiales bacterium]
MTEQIPDAAGRALQVARSVLEPAAEGVDRSSAVPRGHLVALAGAGLWGLALGDPAALGAVHEALAGGCGATTFVWAQHHSPLRLLAASRNEALRQRWLAPLSVGEQLAGIAFSHLRRRGRPALRAEPAAGGAWSVRGQVPWLSGWGIDSMFVVGTWLPGDRVLWWALERPDPPGASPGSVQAEAISLSVFSASSTVTLALDVVVGETDVLSVEDGEAWRQRDRLATAAPSRAALGLARRCLELLGAAKGRAASTASAMLIELDRLRA